MKHSYQSVLHFGVSLLLAAEGGNAVILGMEEKVFQLPLGCWPMFELKPRDHPLKTLRENAGLSQIEVSKLTGVSATRLSLCENRLLDLGDAEEESIRKSIVSACKERHAVVLKDADPRFQEAMRRVTVNAGHKKLFDHLRESLGYSELEGVVFVLGRDYPR